MPDYTDEEIIKGLASLSELDYQRRRADAAKMLDLSVTALDKCVREARKPGLFKQALGKIFHAAIDHGTRKATSSITKKFK